MAQEKPLDILTQTQLLKKMHHQLRSILCGRCKLLSHGHMVTAVGGHGGYSGGKQFILAEELREKLSDIRHEKVLIVKLGNQVHKASPRCEGTGKGPATRDLHDCSRFQACILEAYKSYVSPSLYTPKILPDLIKLPSSYSAPFGGTYFHRSSGYDRMNRTPDISLSAESKLSPVSFRFICSPVSRTVSPSQIPKPAADRYSPFSRIVEAVYSPDERGRCCFQSVQALETTSLLLSGFGSSVDIVDFNGSFLARVRDLTGANPIILVVTKEAVGLGSYAAIALIARPNPACSTADKVHTQGDASPTPPPSSRPTIMPGYLSKTSGPSILRFHFHSGMVEISFCV
ncbi:putative nitric oxide synthase [Platanthera guangdongensis]|uniref:Nitric oxide synthase n=1 Tax=Platanthera guangdongensis TaxID=2320717 RepID=A0ABR2N272_9ASPA